MLYYQETSSINRTQDPTNRCKFSTLHRLINDAVERMKSFIIRSILQGLNLSTKFTILASVTRDFVLYTCKETRSNWLIFIYTIYNAIIFLLAA